MLDSERKQGFAEAMRTCEILAQTYAELGDELIELPRASIAKRHELVVEHIGKAAAR